MAREIIVGCCGWSYFRPKEFSNQLNRPYGSTLQAYAQLFRAVEVNVTFYRIPQTSTAERWRSEARHVNRRFLFTVKAPQAITHIHRFGKRAGHSFKQVMPVAEHLHAPILLFQSPASFTPSAANIKKMNDFFDDIQPSSFLLAWEPRGRWFDEPAAIEEVCQAHQLILCVDPFRNEPMFPAEKRYAYFRLHGLGRPSMYRYDFSRKELENLNTLINALPPLVKRAYIFFNNVACYRNALDFVRMRA